MLLFDAHENETDSERKLGNHANDASDKNDSEKGKGEFNFG